MHVVDAGTSLPLLLLLLLDVWPPVGTRRESSASFSRVRLFGSMLKPRPGCQPEEAVHNNFRHAALAFALSCNERKARYHPALHTRRPRLTQSLLAQRAAVGIEGADHTRERFETSLADRPHVDTPCGVISRETPLCR